MQRSYLTDLDFRRIRKVECREWTNGVKDRSQGEQLEAVTAIQAGEAGSLDCNSGGRDGKKEKN